jgi:hypothetical protein
MTSRALIAVVLVAVLVVGGAVGITYLVTSGGTSRSGVDARAATARACKTAVRVYDHMEGLATNARGGQYTYPARYQVDEVVAAFHADGVPAALVRQADRVDRASRGGPSVDTDVRLDLLVTACE